HLYTNLSSPTYTSTLSLHDALPICSPFQNYLVPGIILFTILGIFPLIISVGLVKGNPLSLKLTLILAYSLIIWIAVEIVIIGYRSEEHTSELQSRENLVCRLLLEKK